MSQPWYAEHYRRPDLVALEGTIRAFARSADAADSADAFLAVLTEWNTARSEIDTGLNIAMVRYAQDTRDQEAKQEQDFWNEAAPVLRELDVLWATSLLATSYQDALVDRYGEQLVALKRAAASTFSPAIKEALTEEAKLGTKYTEVCAKKEIEFRGDTYNLTGIAKFFSDANRDTRREAHQARDAFLAANAAELEGMYDRLVELRDSMGRALGNDSFTPLGYQLMSRTSYGPDEVAVFRDAIHAEIVPIAQELRQRQAARLGVDELLYHDESVWDPSGSLEPIGDDTFVLDEAAKMYDELGSDLGSFFRMMRDRDLFDVELREGKAGGGFCTQFDALEVPFVFANFNGSDDDIMVITHECGHAFQAYTSRKQPLVELVFPTYEACEVHSMSMEYLTHPWMERFFGGDADRYRRTHLERAVTMLPYTACVDHFQHRVYAEPTLSSAERNDLWLEMEARYQPHRKYGGLYPHISKGTIWQRQLHIFDMPFYYIDYALAEVCALQMWMKAERDRDQAMKDYFAICEVGGRLSFTDMLEVGNLRSPFDPDCLREVADHLRSRVLA